jgi:glycosyltransferase involved in cell wall biosynthesis
MPNWPTRQADLQVSDRDAVAHGAAVSNDAPPRPLHLCHVFSSFCPGGAEVRTITIINALGPAVTHTIIATDGRYDAADRLSPDGRVTLVPPPSGKGGLLYGLALRRTLAAIRPDLLLTYNWGAIDAVIGGVLGRVCPIVHAEDGFGTDEVVRLKRRRVWTRRIFLNAITRTVVPSTTLLHVAREQYRLPAHKVQYIPNGVDLRRFAPSGDRSWRAEQGIADEAVVFGFVGALRPEKRLDYLLKAFAQSRVANARLVIVGDGPCRTALEAEAADLALGESVVFAGPLLDPAAAYAAFDVFAMSSVTEQMPIVVLEAMATGLPVIGTDVGDTANMLGSTAADTVVHVDDMNAYVETIRRFARDRSLRDSVGARNRQRAEREFDLALMIRRYVKLYYTEARRPLPPALRMGQDDASTGV